MSDKPTPETDAVMTDKMRDGNDLPDLARRLERERDDYKNHFEACEAQRQRQLVELERLRKDLCEIAEGCHVGHPDIEESKRRIIAIREERDALRAEVERLKADGKRLDWLKELDPDSRAWVKIADAICIREAIDSAMKGELK